MEGVDPDTLLEWLQTGVGDERDIQLMALEQLCMLLLMSDNIDQCFESCPPRTFLPALCKIFLDETATESVLEVTARAITYYLDVSNECTRRITQVDGAVKAICNRLAVAEMSDRTSKDLAEQCVKLLEHVCQRETSAVYDAGGLQCMLTLVRQHGQFVHKDTIHSAMSVITRLCSKMEPSDSVMPECSASLGALLEHDDPKVSECALRCFAALTDRFIRKFMDPVEMARHGKLVEHLLNSLVPFPLAIVTSSSPMLQMKNVSSSASIISSDSMTSSPAVGSYRSASFISVVFSLLCNLCRGSSAVTQQVVSSPLLIFALKSILTSKDGRCIMDALRLYDLLVVILCEGRSALMKSTGSTITCRNDSGPNWFDRSQRHLIDAVRQHDMDALTDAIESGQVDVNFTDDVGQTLLNWSSAFGTAEMVTFLCDKGADVNRGQRSSSLHYAACFGRPDVVKVLLKYGANPDLRDEEGKTALDKAKERSEEGHQQVASILENPSVYMQRDNDEKPLKVSTNVAKETTGETVDAGAVRLLLEQILPVLCDVYQRSLGTNVHRLTLSLLRKTVYYISRESMEFLVSNDDNEVDFASNNCIAHEKRFAENLASVLMMGLEHEEDTEAHENILHIIKSLFLKNTDFWLDQLVRVGIFEKVDAIANQPAAPTKGGVVTTMIIDESGRISSASTVTVMDSVLVKANELTQDGNPVLSNERSITEPVNSNKTDESAALSMATNDRTLLNIPIYGDEANNVQAIRPTGGAAVASPLTHETPSSGSSAPVMHKYSTSIDLSSAVDDQWEIVQGKSYRWKDWRLIRSLDSFFIWCDAVAVEFSDGSNGWFRFMLDGQLNTMYSGTPETGSDNVDTRGEFLDKLTKARNAVPPGSLLNAIFSVPATNRTIEVGNWILASPKPCELTVTNRDGNQQRTIIVEDLPGFIFESNRQTRHCFQAEKTLGLDFVTGWAARGGGRRLRFRAETQKAKLQKIAKEIWNNYLKEAQSKPRDALVELQKASSAVKELCQRKTERLSEHMLLELEIALKKIHSSVVNDRLLSTFELSISGIVDALLIFLDFVHYDAEGEMSLIFKKVFADQRSLAALVRKMVSVLDATEKFPQYLYDTPGGSSFGLQLLNRRIKLKLEQLNPNTPMQMQLLDRTGRTMKSEPLVTVKQLKGYILRMVAKQWYDHERETFHFVEEVNEAKREGRKLSFVHATDFDDRGIIYWLGTNGKTEAEWTNPASVNVVFVTSSDGERLPYGRHEDILSRDANALNCHTSDDRNAHFTIDLGVYVYPNTYTLRHARGYGRSALRNWLLQGSCNGQAWDVLVVHESDASLNYPGSTATWPIVCSEGKGPYRYIRIAQNGKNASNQNHYLSLSGFEIYGDVVDVVVDDFKLLKEKQNPSNTVVRRSKKCALDNKDAIPSDDKSTTEASSSFNSSSVHMATSLNDTAVNYLPGGQSNNKIASGILSSDMMHTPINPVKNRLLRGRRSSRLLVANAAVRGIRAANSMDTCLLGSRVIRGPDWKWDNQGNNTEGTVISLIENGWVDVQWDDRTSNSYRFGAGGKYDVELKSVSSSASLSRTYREVNKRLEHHSTTWCAAISSQVPPSLARQLPPVPPPYREHSPTGALWNAAPSATHFSRHNQSISSRDNTEMALERTPSFSCRHCGLQKHRTNGCANILDCSSSHTREISEKEGNEDTALAKSLTMNQPSSTIAQKSMSTTNLFDGCEADKLASVASTNQAASAESLQHQTPSLENLLARSRIFDDRILEVVPDEIPSNLENQITTDSLAAVDTDQESISTNNNVVDSSFDNFDGTLAVAERPSVRDISLAVSTFAAGSQPVLFDGNAEVFGETQLIGERRDSLNFTLENNPTSENSIHIMSLEDANARNLANLSISAPNLVFLRQRQQSGPALNTDQVLPGDDDFVRNILQDLVGDQSQFRGVRHIAISGSGTSLITDDSDNVIRDAIRQYLLDDERVENSIVGAVPQMAHQNASISSEVNDHTDATTPAIADENKEHLVSVVHETLAGVNTVTNSISDGVSLTAFPQGVSTTQQLYDTIEKSETPGEGAGASQLDVTQHSSSKSSRGTRTGAQPVGGSLRSMQNSNYRSRLGSYADVLRTVVMQQIIDSGGSVNGLELEEDDNMYDDEMQDEGNEDDCDEEFGNGLSMETVAQAASALRGQSNGGNTGSNGELKFNWKQIVMSQAGRLIGDRGLRSSTSCSDDKQVNGAINRNWDDEFTLKHQLPALIPAFDPRPGRINVNQTQDVELPQNASGTGNEPGPSGCPVKLSESKDMKLRLYIRGPNLANVGNVTIELADDDRSIFYYLQQLMEIVEWGQKNERTRRVWEPTYTLLYGDARDDNELPQSSNNRVAEMNRIPDNVAQTLTVVSKLHQIAVGAANYEMAADTFVSEKLTQKLMQVLADPLIVSARAWPTWCDELIFKYPCLFSVETRTNFFRATAFGTTRSIVWLQTRRDQILEQSRGTTSTATVSNLAGARRDDHYPEFRIGRIKHERIKVPRSDKQLFDYAVRLMQFHASRKAILEIEYIDEEGTGLGPTLEFYALMAAEFQRKSLAMWMCDDSDNDQTNEIDLGEGLKPPGYYVRRSGGLFPAPLPPRSAESSHASELFRILGIFLAKVLQDGRLVDMPLSRPFLKIITNSEVAEGKVFDLNGVLNLDDLEEISPTEGYLLKELAAYVERKRAIEVGHYPDTYTQQRLIQELKININGSEFTVEDLSLTFCVNPSSSVFGYEQVELIENGADIDVTAENVDFYIATFVDYYFNTGIRNQLTAFREGFDQVFPLRNLRLFVPEELQTLLSGEQCPEWTREDIINYTEPKLGYTKESLGFLRFVDVLVGMNASERKSFLQFTTGCSSLPPGGLANLHPRLTIVRKVDSGDGSYPSVNTCVHYLKLPDYSSVEIMRERLLTATNEKGFHLN